MFIEKLTKRSVCLSPTKGTSFKKSTILYFVLLFIGSTSGDLNAQILSKMRFENMNKMDGLPSNHVSVITKDNLGYMWFGTNNGLCRYETPNRIKVYKVDENIKGGLKSENISAIHIDRENDIWVGTRLGGLSKYNQTKDEWQTFTNNPLDSSSISNDEILDIKEDSKGRIWIGTENGLNVFQPEDDSFFCFKIDRNDPEALKTKAILSIEEDDKGWIWVGTWEGGVHLLIPPANGNIKHATFRSFNPPENVKLINAWDIFQDKQKRYWIGTINEGLYLMQLPQNASNNPLEQNWKPKFHNYSSEVDNYKSLSNDNVIAINQDSKNRIWIGTVYGVNVIEPEQLAGNESDKVTEKRPEINFDCYYNSKKDLNSLANDAVTTIYEDKQGIIWIGTYNGISMHNWFNNQFDNFLLTGDFNAPTTQNFYLSPENVGWLTTGNKGIIQFDFNTHEIRRIDSADSDILVNDNAISIYSPDDENIYIGLESGVQCFNNKTSIVTNYPYSLELLKEYHNLIINTLIEDKYGRLWISTPRGLFWLDKNTGKYHALQYIPNDSKSLSDNTVIDIYIDTYENLWVATYNGLNRIPLGATNDFQITSFKYDPQNPKTSIPSNRLISIMQAKDILYIGTTNGLCGYDYQTGNFLNFTKDNYKFSVQSLEKTADDNLWGSTNEGIFYFDTEEKSFDVFEQRDGISDVNFRPGSSQVGEEGSIYFGNRTGVVRLQPNKLVANTIPPPVYVTEMKTINSESENVLSTINKKEIILAYNNYYLSIDFSAVNYNSIEKNTYAYKLEGFEEDWNYSDNNMSAVYTNLEYGEYTFRVKAANNNGVWNEQGATLRIVKVAAFWQTNWFRALVLIASALLIWLIFLIYTNSIRRKNDFLNEHNTVLTKEIQERRRIEGVLQEREEFLRLIMDNIPQHIYWVDKTHNILGCNTSFLEGFEYQNETEIIGKKSLDIFELTSSRMKIENAEQEVLESGNPIFNQVIKVKDAVTKEEVWMAKNYIPLKEENGEVFGVLVTGEDITAHVKAEEILKDNSKQLEIQVLLRTQELALKNKEIQSLLQAKEARNEELEEIVKQRTQELNEFNKELQQSNNDLGQFAYIASHDMKEPLRIIGNFAGLLSRKYKGKLDKSADEYIHYIEDGIKRMSALMDSLLTYSQVGKKEIQLSKTKLNNILFAKLHDLSAIIEERNVEMQVDDLPEIYCEKDQIGMVFFNLINNGIKFNKKEKPIIKVKVHDDAPEGFWKFSVTDNGIGISPEFQSQIFEIFRRLHSKQEYKGSGIGLALTQKIVIRHGGTIKVVSIPTEGTTFIFTIAKIVQEEMDTTKKTIVRLNQSATNKMDK